MLLRRLKVGAVLACGAVAISTCSNGDTGREDAVPVPLSSVPPSTTSPPSVVPCSSEQLQMTRPRTDGAAGTITAIVAVSNSAETSCALPDDHPDIDFLGASGALVPLQVEKEPAPSTGRLVISPGGQAFFFIRYDNSGSECSRIQTLRVNVGTEATKDVAASDGQGFFVPCGGTVTVSMLSSEVLPPN